MVATPTNDESAGPQLNETGIPLEEFLKAVVAFLFKMSTALALIGLLCGFCAYAMGLSPYWPVILILVLLMVSYVVVILGRSVRGDVAKMQRSWLGGKDQGTKEEL